MLIRNTGQTSINDEYFICGENITYIEQATGEYILTNKKYKDYVYGRC